MFLLAEETVFQQQVRTLWSIEGTLTFIAVALVFLILLGCGCIVRLGKLWSIGKAIVEEHKKANTMLQYLNDRAYDEAIKKKPIAPPPARRDEPEVYRID